MTTAGTVASTGAGLLLIGVVARDVVDTVFHPEGRGTLAKLVDVPAGAPCRGRARAAS